MGWIQEHLSKVIKRIRGKSTPKKLGSSPQKHTGKTSKTGVWEIDISELNGKTREEFELEKAVELVERGVTTDKISSQFIHLTPSQIEACVSLAKARVEPSDIKYVGGTKAVIDRIIKEAIERNKKIENAVERFDPCYTPNGGDIVGIMIKEKMDEEKKEQFRIKNPNRMSFLQKIYDAASELIISRPTFNEQDVIDYANKSGEFQIDVTDKTTGIQELDVTAAIRLAYAVNNKEVKENQLKEVGGPAKIIDEMSVMANVNALDASRLDNAKDFLMSPTKVISRMPKEVVIKENLRFL